MIRGGGPVRKKMAMPFYGEFGFEVMLWAPWLRAQQVHTVYCRRGHERLYEDFAQQFVPWDAPPEGMPDCHYLLRNGRPIDQRVRMANAVTVHNLPVCSHPTGCPLSVSMPNYRHVELGKGPATFNRDLLFIHARACEKQPERNWPRESWNELLQLIQEAWPSIHIITIGLVTHALDLDGCEDRRGADLGWLADHLRNQVIIGPSSGPLCLALASPVGGIVTWSGNAIEGGKDIECFQREWNPFRVKVAIEPGWQPSPRRAFEMLCTFYQ